MCNEFQTLKIYDTTITIAISNTMVTSGSNINNILKKDEKKQSQVYEGTHSYTQPKKSPVNSENYIFLRIGVFVKICCMQTARLLLWLAAV